MAGLLSQLGNDLTCAANSCLPQISSAQAPNFNGLMMPTNSGSAVTASTQNQRNNGIASGCIAGQNLPSFYQKAYNSSYGNGLASRNSQSGPSCTNSGMDNSTPTVGAAPNITYNIPQYNIDTANGRKQGTSNSCIGAQLASKVPALAINQGVKAIGGMFKGSIGGSLSNLLSSGDSTSAANVADTAASSVTSLSTPTCIVGIPGASTVLDTAGCGIAAATCAGIDAATGSAGIAGCVALDSGVSEIASGASCAATAAACAAGAAGAAACVVPGIGAGISSIMDFVNGNVGAGLGELGGAAIGTAIFPGIGTAIGGLLGSVVGGSSVICTELYVNGILPYEVYMADDRYGSKLPRHVVLGYHTWARAFTRKMRTSVIARYIGKTIGVAWANEMAFREGVKTAKPNLLGKFLLLVGVPICGFIGKLRAR